MHLNSKMRSPNNIATSFTGQQVFVVIVVVLFYGLITWINVYHVDFKGATVDAQKFHDLGLDWANYGKIQFVVSTEFYAQLLGILYRYIYPSQFLGASINIISTIVTFIYFRKILLRIQSFYIVVPILLVLLWPSYIPRATTTMREPLMLMFFSIFTYSLLVLQANYNKKNLMLLLIGAAGMFLLHKAFAVLVFILLVYMTLVSDLFTRHKSKIISSIARLLFICFIAVIFYSLTSVSSDIRGLSVFNALYNTDKEYIDKVLQYKVGHSARATYNATIDTSSILSFILSVPWVMLNYLLQPFPWRISNIYDIAAFIEVAFRSFLVLYVVKYRKILSTDHKIMLVLYLATTAMWAAGTTNYGTASRHHTTHTWLLILVAYSLKSYIAKYSSTSIRSLRTKRSHS